MGLLRFLRGDDLLERRSTSDGESRALPRPDNELPLLAPYATYGAFGEKAITPETALMIADVWSAVRVLADAASSLPIHVYRRAGEGRERVTSGKLVDLLERPGPGTSQADLVSTLIAHVLVWGGAFIAKYRQAGEISQLALLHPDRVQPELNAGQLRYRYSPPRGPQQLLGEQDIVHVKGLSVDGLNGLSAVGQAARVLGLSDELVRHALAFFERGTERPAGVLQVPPDMSKESMDRLREALKATGKPHGVMLIDADAEYHELTSRLDDAQFVEQRRLTCQEICRVFRIPSHMLNAGSGGDSLTYSNTEQLSLDFVKYSLSPWLRRIELAISNDADLAFARQFV